MALAAVAACNKSEIVSVSEGNAIAFDNAFVDNATKSVNDPSYSSAEGGKMFTDFQVYGFVEGAPLFGTDGKLVVKNNNLNSELSSAWQYEGTQYWIAGAKYNFAAVAPATGWTKTDASKGGVSLSFINDGTHDVLYAQSAEITGRTDGNEVVAFTFRHILSKVKFSFENGYNASTATIKVENIKINNAFKIGNVALTNAATTWSNQAGEVALDFGAAVADNADTDADAYAYGNTLESYNELLLIPSDATDYQISFDVKLYVSEELIKTYNHTAVANFAPVAGNCYDIKAVINAENIDPENEQEPIEFTVTAITGWAGPTDQDATVNQNTGNN